MGRSAAQPAIISPGSAHTTDTSCTQPAQSVHNSIKAEHKHSTVVENDVRGSNLEDCVQHYVSSRQNDYYSIVVSGFDESWVKTQHRLGHTVPLDI